MMCPTFFTYALWINYKPFFKKIAKDLILGRKSDNVIAKIKSL